MLSRKPSHLLAPLAFALLAAGCSTPVPVTPKADVPVESRTGTAPGAGGAAGQGTAQSNVTPVDLTKGSGAAGASRVVYFDYDSFVVKDEYRPVIETDAKRLTGARSQRISIEGHTDERGGREYNLALGQKRAEAVAKMLTLLGVNEGQVEAVSFGKERPAAQGSDEQAYARNRRAEIKDK